MLSVGLSLLLSSVLVLVVPHFLFIIGITIILASLNQTLGLRKLYVTLLLRVFEYARQVSITKQVKKQEFSIFYESSDDEDPDLMSTENLHRNGQIAPPGNFKSSFGKRNGQIQSQENVKPKPFKSRLVRKDTRHNVISRKDNLMLIPSKPDLQRINSFEENEDEVGSLPKKILGGHTVSLSTFQRDFELSDVLDYVKTGVASIIEDEVTSRFVAEELKSWNLMTRTNSQFEFINWRLTGFYVCGWFFRYCMLFPARLTIFFIGMCYLVLSCITLAWVPNLGLRNWLYDRVALIVFQCLSRCFSAQINFHNLENRPQKDGICVANHTSPIDVVILSTDRAYALVGQSHGGLMGVVQNSLSKAASHIWFQRSEVKDRSAVARRLAEHVEDPTKLPILIFPEGTCINNTSVMQFKKGSFEVGGVIYPVAIKYDSQFGDAFWNSSRYSMITYVLMMMTSWAIVCDVWYLPPMKLEKNENAIDFANRVKKEIARKGGLVDLLWDGNLKRQEVKSEWKAAQQEQFSRRFRVE